MGPEPPSPGTMSWYIIDMESSKELEPWRSFCSKMLSITAGRSRMYYHVMTVDNHHMMGFDIKTHWIQWSVWLEWMWTTYVKFSEVEGHFEKFTWQGGPSHFVLTFQDHDTSHNTSSEASLGRMILHIPMGIIHNSRIVYVSTAKTCTGSTQKIVSQNLSSPKLCHSMENQFCPFCCDPHTYDICIICTFSFHLHVVQQGSGPVSEWSVEFDLQRLVGSLQGE